MTGWIRVGSSVRRTFMGLSGTIYLTAGKNAFRPGFFIRVSVSSGGNAIW